MKKLFTERHGLIEPRIKEELGAGLMAALFTVVNAKIDENLFGQSFSLQCPDPGDNNIGCDLDKLKEGLAAYKVIWPREWPKSENEWPTDGQVFDLLEFLYEYAGLPKSYAYHSFF